MNQVWLSFVDPALPDGEAFLGVAIVEVDDVTPAERLELEAMRAEAGHSDPGGFTDKEALVVLATSKAWDLGINPGGEVAAFSIEGAPSEWTNRLLTHAEIDEMNRQLAPRG